MKKFGNYFPHFSNARTDRKIINLIRKYGWAGYAYYFVILEVLREQPDFKLPLSEIGSISWELRVEREIISDIVANSGLFEIVDQMFFSPRFNNLVQPLIERSNRARAAVQKRWKNTNVDTNVSSNEYTKKGKEKKRKESERENTSHAHTREENFKNESLNNNFEKKEKTPPDEKWPVTDVSHYLNPNDYTDDQKRQRANFIFHELENAGAWLDDVARITRRPLDRTFEMVKEFLYEIKAKEDYFKPLSEIKKHCVSWIKKNYIVPKKA